MNRLRWLVLLALVGLALFAGCAAESYPPPPETGDGWETASLAEVGLAERPLEQAIERIESGRYPRVHSLVIARDGKLVFEAYFPGYAWEYGAGAYEGEYTEFDRDTLHTSMSVTKAFTSAIVGIALDEGYFTGVDQPVAEIFPEYAQYFNGGKERITLEHLLTMTSGLAWNEAGISYGSIDNDLIQLFVVEDPVAYILAKPLKHAPGSYWYYSGGDVNLLGEAIQQATGERMDLYAAERLFAPLGIEDYEWDYINADTVHASGNMMIRPHDLAKFGQLILDEGLWQGKQVVPAEWIAQTKTPFIETFFPEMGEWYGYQWWLKEYPYGDTTVTGLNRTGWGGQQITIFDDLEMVVVFTGGNYLEADPNDDVIRDHILPAVLAGSK